MPLRLAFDLDGTVADLRAALARETAILFSDVRPDDGRGGAGPGADGRALATGSEVGGVDGEESTDTALHRISSTQEAELWAHVARTPDFWTTLEEIVPGAIARLAALAADRGWDVRFVTTRPATAGGSVEVQSRLWLEDRGFPDPDVSVVRGSRGKIASALGLDLVVDDRPENCVDVVADSTAHAVLIWRDGVESALRTLGRRILTLGITPVATIGDCLDMLERLDRSDDPDVIRRALGDGLRAAVTATLEQG